MFRRAERCNIVQLDKPTSKLTLSSIAAAVSLMMINKYGKYTSLLNPLSPKRSYTRTNERFETKSVAVDVYFLYWWVKIFLRRDDLGTSVVAHSQRFIFVNTIPNAINLGNNETQKCIDPKE